LDEGEEVWAFSAACLIFGSDSIAEEINES
jgi:hypothetical protein